MSDFAVKCCAGPCRSTIRSIASIQWPPPPLVACGGILAKGWTPRDIRAGVRFRSPRYPDDVWMIAEKIANETSTFLLVSLSDGLVQHENMRVDDVVQYLNATHKIAAR